MAEASDSIRRRAASIVLGRLGEEMMGVVEHHLRRSYGISLKQEDSSKFSLEQLHFALSVLLGEGHANNLLRQITIEMEEIMREQVH